MRYWNNLFTYETWTRRHPRKASWAANRHKTAAELTLGNIVIAYIAKIGWTGTYRTTSTAELDPSGPLGEEYPLLADIEPIVELEPEEALTIADLPDDAPLRRWPGGHPGPPRLRRGIGDPRYAVAELWFGIGRIALPGPVCGRPSMDSRPMRRLTPLRR